jgi:hypothetical protein
MVEHLHSNNEAQISTQVLPPKNNKIKLSNQKEKPWQNLTICHRINRHIKHTNICVMVALEERNESEIIKSLSNLMKTFIYI